MKFDEFAIVDQSKQSIGKVKDQGVSEHVELQVKVLDKVCDSILVQPIQVEVHDCIVEVDAQQQQQQYNIAIVEKGDKVNHHRAMLMQI